jgi:hypothetical protein
MKNHLNWYDVPEYSTVIKCFFKEMLTHDLFSFGELAINTSRSVLRNQIMIVYLLQIIFKKTR